VGAQELCQVTLTGVEGRDEPAVDPPVAVLEDLVVQESPDGSSRLATALAFAPQPANESTQPADQAVSGARPDYSRVAHLDVCSPRRRSEVCAAGEYDEVFLVLVLDECENDLGMENTGGRMDGKSVPRQLPSCWAVRHERTRLVEHVDLQAVLAQVVEHLQRSSQPVAGDPVRNEGRKDLILEK
jgi:hypothetical protein